MSENGEVTVDSRQQPCSTLNFLYIIAGKGAANLSAIKVKIQKYFSNSKLEKYPSYITFKATIYVQPMDREPLNFLYQCQWGLLGCQPWTGAKRYHSVRITNRQYT